MTQTNLSTLIDALGHLKAEIAKLERRETDLKEELGKLGPGAYEGEVFRLNISDATRETLNMQAVRKKLTPQFIRANTTEKVVRSLRVSARNGDVD